MSYKKCVVSNCRLLKMETLHRIPKKPANRMIWLDNLNLPETVHGRVCSKHFEPQDFDIKGDGHIWLKSNSYPKRVELDGIEAIDCPIDSKRRCTTKINCVASTNTFDDESNQIANDDSIEWKETVINIDDLSSTGKSDTIADLQMDCSVYAVYHNNTYENHNYSKFAKTANKRELQFNIKSCRILSSSLASQ